MTHPLSDTTRPLASAGLEDMFRMESHFSPVASSTMADTVLDSSEFAGRRSTPNGLNTKASSAHRVLDVDAPSQNNPEPTYEELLNQVSAELPFLSQDHGVKLDEEELEKILDNSSSEVWTTGGAGSGKPAKEGL
jgi:hypothetical protein